MRVRYNTQAPPIALAGYVKMYWAFEIEDLHGKPYVYRSLADGCAELVFHYKSRFAELTDKDPIPPSFSHVHAQTQRHRRFVTDADFGIFGAYIYPHALPALFGHSAHSLTDLMPTLKECLGKAGAELEERIMLAQDNRERASLLTGFLLKRLQTAKAPPPTLLAAANEIFRTDGKIPIESLCKSSGWSHRHMERSFKEYIGFSPKRLSRILRFQAATRTLGTNDRTLTALALDCGYYDQAHFIREFREFAGYSPSEFFHGKPEGAEYREV